MKREETKISLNRKCSHLAIRGTSFCGSTVTSYILGSLSKCANIGESHWITSDKQLGCIRCGSNCSVINDDLRAALGRSNQNWYELIRLALSAEVLISSDKDPAILGRLDPNGNRRELFVFKHPGENLLSYTKVTSEKPDECYENYFKNWLRIYSWKYPKETRASIFLYFNDLLIDPYSVTKQIAEVMDVEYTASSVNLWWRYEHHTVGGNYDPFDEANAHLRKLKPPKQFNEDTLPVVVKESNIYKEATNIFLNMLNSSEMRISI